MYQIGDAFLLVLMLMKGAFWYELYLLIQILFTNEPPCDAKQFLPFATIQLINGKGYSKKNAEHANENFPLELLREPSESRYWREIRN